MSRSFCAEWRKICKQILCKVVRRALCGVALIIKTVIANNYDCSNFVKYLNLTASNVTLMGIPYSSDASFTFESMTSDGNFATLTDSYISPSGGYGKFTFIVENVKGRFFVNDMYYDSAPDMVDKLVRPEFINSPTPNYWQSDENLAAERILTAVQ
ncbi:MAG: hypothetical protein J6A30_01265 [Ruminococcus sp.]|nr:hypothetical protein [Ruminococcus sp.]